MLKRLLPLLDSLTLVYSTGSRCGESLRGSRLLELRHLSVPFWSGYFFIRTSLEKEVPAKN